MDTDSGSLRVWLAVLSNIVRAANVFFEFLPTTISSTIRGRVELCAAGPGKTDNVPSWLESLAELRPTPDEYALYTMSWDATLSFLKITESTLDILVDNGLRYRDIGAQRFFEQHDVWTIGFYSHSNRSVPELASKSVLRFARGTVEEWIRPVSWRVRTFATCPERDKCDGTWTHAPVRVDELDGRLVETTVGPGGGAPVPGGQVGGKPAMAVLDCVAESRGLEMEIRSPEAREVYRETLNELRTGRIRFQAMPAALRNEPDLARPNRTANCMSAAIYMARALAAAGLPSRSRNGYLAGVGALPHGWTEIYEDGVWKILDPTVVFVAEHWYLKGAEADYFADFCAGSWYNRLIPCECDAGAELVTHTHDSITFAEVQTEVDARVAVS